MKSQNAKRENRVKQIFALSFLIFDLFL
jgi:hypothetical protein